MKATVTNMEKKTIPFPKLMQSNRGKIVFFSGPCVGILLHNAQSPNLVWNFSDDWNMDAFFDFEGSITLSND